MNFVRKKSWKVCLNIFICMTYIVVISVFEVILFCIIFALLYNLVFCKILFHLLDGLLYCHLLDDKFYFIFRSQQSFENLHTFNIWTFWWFDEWVEAQSVHLNEQQRVRMIAWSTGTPNHTKKSLQKIWDSNYYTLNGDLKLAL